MRRYGVLERPGVALRAMATELAICGGQLFTDRTTAGLRGRIRGWRAAAGLVRLEAPREHMPKLTMRDELAMRARRNR